MKEVISLGKPSTIPTKMLWLDKEGQFFLKKMCEAGLSKKAMSEVLGISISSLNSLITRHSIDMTNYKSNRSLNIIDIIKPIYESISYEDAISIIGEIYNKDDPEQYKSTSNVLKMCHHILFMRIERVLLGEVADFLMDEDIKDLLIEAIPEKDLRNRVEISNCIAEGMVELSAMQNTHALICGPVFVKAMIQNEIGDATDEYRNSFDAIVDVFIKWECNKLYGKREE